jgi:tetratricopeptide (TPR) repeat protein/energy-coupling factor transporter ATP-binding protein EcfA2
VKNDKAHANPFPGLRPFQFHENHLFFGREGQSEALLRKLRRNRFLAVVGTSGSGKSSLVRAGLLPLLYGGFMTQAGPQWRIALFRPGKDPIHNMAVALNSPTPFEPGYMEGTEDLAAETSAGQAAPDEKLDADLKLVKVAALETTLRRSAVGLVDYVRRARMREGENLLVVVDQFEELFRFKEKAEGQNSQDEAAAFVKLLLEAVEDGTAPIYVVLTMRSDFLGDCSQFRDLPEKINESQYLIPRMTRDQRRDAITSPAAVRGAKMTQRLLNRLLNDVGDNPDHLPILQHALMRTWDFWAQDNGDSGEIDLQHYEAIGGMEQALSLHADEAYNSLPDARSKQIAEKMFKALTETVTDSREVRRPSELREICAVAEATEEEVKTVIEVFRNPGRSFLMPPPGVELEANTLVDISHESLIRNWALLKEWVKDEAQSARIYRRVAEAAALNREGKEGLLTDPGLQFALDWREKVKPNKAWAKRYHPEFDVTLDFLKKSEERRDELLAEEERRKQEELERDKRELVAAQALAEAEQRRAQDQSRAARKFRLLAAALAVMLLVAAGTAVYAYILKRVAETARERAQAAQQEALLRSEQLDAALKGKEAEKIKAENEKANADNERVKADKAKRDAEEQAKAAKKAEERARLAQVKEKKQRDIADTRALKLKTTLDNLNHANAKNVKSREGLEALERGDIKSAEKTFTELFNLQNEDAKSKAWIEYLLGAVYRKSGDYYNAVKNYQDSLNIREREYGKDSPEVAATLGQLARVYREQGNYTEAEEKYNRLLEIVNSHASKDALYDLKSEVADLYVEQMQDAGAEMRDARENQYVQRSKTADSKYDEKEGLAKIDPKELEKQIDNLYAVVVKKYADAEKLYEEVASFREQAYLFDKFLPNHPELAASYSSLAEFYQTIGDADKEELGKGLYELARAIRASKLKPEHAKDPGAVDILGNIGDAYRAVNRMLPAARLYEEMLTVAETAYATDAVPLGWAFRKVGQFYRSQKMYAKAEPLYLKILPLLEKNPDKTLSEGVPDLQEAIGTLYWEEGKFEEAESYLKKARAGREKRRPTEEQTEKQLQWNLITNARLMARLFSKQKRFAEAEALFKQTLVESETTFGADNAATIGAIYDLGHFYFEQRRDDEAEPLLKRVQQYYLSKIGPEKRAAAGFNASSLETALRNGFGTHNTLDIYTETLSNLAEINGRRAEKQGAESVEAKALSAEAEAMYQEMVGTLRSLPLDLPATGLNSPFDRNEFYERNSSQLSKEFAFLLSRSLESYAAYLKKLKRTGEADRYEASAKGERSQAGTYTPPPWKP